MELVTTLKGQTVQNIVRDVGINPNHWYPVAWAETLKPGQVIPNSGNEKCTSLGRPLSFCENVLL